MNAGLQMFSERNAGFKQFCDQYSLVSADPSTQKEYARWLVDQMREDGIREAARLEGREEGREEGVSLGEIKYCFIKLKRTVSQIADEFGIGQNEVTAALKQLNLSHDE